MDYQDEQQNELEALQEIYYNEIKVLSRTSPHSLVIKIQPESSISDDSFNTSEGEEDDDEDDDDDYDDSEDGDDTFDESQSVKPSSMSIAIKFDLPARYPDEKPSIEILNSQNLDDYDLKVLLSNLQDKADESLGTVMVFTLVNEATEWLVAKTTRINDDLQVEKDRKAKADEEEHVKRFEGTKVTTASFCSWKAKFDAELLAAKLEKSRMQGPGEEAPIALIGGTRRLTGREMFETDKSLIESDLNFDDLDQNQLESLLQVDYGAEDLEQYDDISDNDHDDDLSADESSDEEDTSMRDSREETSRKK